MQQAIKEAKKMIEEMEKDLHNISCVETGAIINKKIQIRAILKLIERLEKQSQNDGWIKAEDSLPDNGIDVNAFFDGEYVWRASYHYNYNQWFRDGATVDEGRITHWHPLHNPPIINPN